MHYDRLVSTIPFVRLLDLAKVDYDRSIYSWNKVLVFNIGFDRKGEDTSNHWIYFPGEEYCFYRVGFYDNILGTDRMSLYVELGFDKNAAINPEEWFPRVLNDLRRAGILNDSQTPVDHESIEKKKQLAQTGIYSIGRYGSWTYCSIEDNIKEAQALADAFVRESDKS